MMEYTIRASDSGQRMDRFCQRILKDAPKSFLFKMFRKKNITLNGNKAQGNERLQENDVIRFYLSDETFEKFQGKANAVQKPASGIPTPDIVYEDFNVLVVNKPAGILSQKAKDNDLSMNEICLTYLQRTGAYDPNDVSAFKPSVCNRLDRNTSGLLLVAKTLCGARMLSKILRERNIGKYYVCVVKGRIEEPFDLKGYLKKDASTNTVRISKEQTAGADPVETSFSVIETTDRLTLLKVHLLTGKTHQIRAHLSSIHHPILGDPKYGDFALNQEYKCNTQMLCAWRIEMPKLEQPFEELSERIIEIPIPQSFTDVLQRAKER